jgi:hypothetical protein
MVHRHRHLVRVRADDVAVKVDVEVKHHLGLAAELEEGLEGEFALLGTNLQRSAP